MIPLHQIKIAKPCPADWNAMTGDAQTRFCAHCKKAVHDLSQMTEAQARALLESANLKACVRVARTADGRIVTRDAAFRHKKIGHKSRGPVHRVKSRVQLPMIVTGGELAPLPMPEPPRPVIQPASPPPPPAPLPPRPLPPIRTQSQITAPAQ